MFNQDEFANILNKINSTYSTMTDFGKKASFDRTYISKYINKKLKNPPTPKILEKVANASNGIVTYEELMTVCGYLDEDVELNLVSKLKSLELSESELEKSITAFIENYITIPDNPSVDIYNMEDSLVYYAYEVITKYYFKLVNKELSTLTNNSNLLIDKQNFFDRAEECAWNEMKTILQNLDKNKIISQLTIEEKVQKLTENLIREKFFNIPILGKITAGQPILAEEYLEGYLPVDPNIYGMTTPDDYFYLKVSGESMNLKVQNGDYALIHKQDYAENGDIIVAIVNGDDEATLKRYKKINDEIVMLEPMSTYPMEPIVINLKETKFQIIGKAIGNFGKF